MGQTSAACDACRKRKVKCDRLKPCSNCKRLNVSCSTSWVGARPRGRLGGRGGNKDSLQSRLARLEDILNTLHKEQSSQDSSTSVKLTTTLEAKTQLDESSSLLHTYVAGPIWSQLSEQIEGLREILSPNSDEEEEYLGTDSPVKADSPAHLDVVFGSFHHVSVTESIHLLHPSQIIRDNLFATYCSNIDGGYKIIHRPTVQVLLSRIDTLRLETVLDAASHALVFAIYAAALMTLEVPQRIEIVGQDHEGVLSTYMSATEQCLVKAEYISSRQLVVRFRDSGPKQWALMALAVQLARGLGLDNAEITSSFPPLERETRLRLWLVLRNLDFRAAYDRGITPVIRPNSYDTPLPSNLNDDDLTEDMKSYPPIGCGITDLSFGFVADQGITLASRLHFLDREEDAFKSPDIWTRRLEMIDEFDRSVNAKYLYQLDTTQPMQWMTSYVAHALSVLCQLLAVRPMTRSKNKQQSPNHLGPRDILARAIQSLRAEGLMYQQPIVRGYYWCCWNQWYVFAVALVEICAAPELSRDVETWSLLQEAYQRQRESIADGEDGRLWRPIKKLFKKVEGIRAEQLLPFGTPEGDQILQKEPVVENVTQLPTPQEDMTFTELMNLDQLWSFGTQQSFGDVGVVHNSTTFWDEFLNDVSTFPAREDWMS